MNILVVGNVLKDIYLNLDTRTEKLETDQKGISWLNLAFNAKKHYFFNRSSNLGGAAVTLEVLTNLGLNAAISGSDLKFSEDGLTSNQPAETYRYILIADDKPTYFIPAAHAKTSFVTPTDFYDYIFVDRSANLDTGVTNQILSYLSLSKNTKLVIYVHDTDNPSLNQLIPHADLLFFEQSQNPSAKTYAPELTNFDQQKIVFLSENTLSCLDVKVPLTAKRLDLLTRLSFYATASATILGCFILGNSVEDSLSLAKANVENSKLNSTLTLEELRTLVTNQPPQDDLELIAANLVLHPKGILAADESGGSIKKKFAQLNIADTYENRRNYRNIFLSTPELDQYVNGVILFDETARQSADNGQNFVDYLTSKHIIPGIKVDQGLQTFNGSLETYTKGLDGLDSRLQEYYNLGLRFAKWRAAFEIRLNDQGEIITPTDRVITENCRILAEYAESCQLNHIVPIVEPELVYDGYYTLEQSAFITTKILDCLFKELTAKNVNLHACILKTNMILAGKQFKDATPSELVGSSTAKVLKEHVPADLAGVVFLSGGQTVEQATANLAAITKNGPFPWPVTFSFARALQDPALYAWQGNNANIKTAQQAFKDRLVANVEALK